MRTVDPVQAVGKMEILAIKVTGMTGADTEVARHGNDHLRRIRGGNRNSDALKAERGASQNGSVNPVEREDKIVQQIRANVIRIAERYTLIAVAIAVPCLNQIHAAHGRSVRVLGEKVPAVEPVAGQVVIQATHGLVFVIDLRKIVGDEGIGARRTRNVVQQLYRDRIQTANRNNITRKWLLRGGIHELPLHAREVALPLRIGQHRGGVRERDVGPPSAPPNWLRFSRSCEAAKKLRAFRSPLRRNSKALP